MKKVLLAAALTLGLSGCWINPKTPYDSVSVIPDMNNPANLDESSQTGRPFYQATPPGKPTPVKGSPTRPAAKK